MKNFNLKIAIIQKSIIDNYQKEKGKKIVINGSQLREWLNEERKSVWYCQNLGEEMSVSDSILSQQDISFDFLLDTLSEPIVIDKEVDDSELKDIALKISIQRALDLVELIDILSIHKKEKSAYREFVLKFLQDFLSNVNDHNFNIINTTEEFKTLIHEEFIPSGEDFLVINFKKLNPSKSIEGQPEHFEADKISLKAAFELIATLGILSHINKHYCFKDASGNKIDLLKNQKKFGEFLKLIFSSLKVYNEANMAETLRTYIKDSHIDFENWDAKSALTTYPKAKQILARQSIEAKS